jgi:hypothetical protein
LADLTKVESNDYLSFMLRYVRPSKLAVFFLAAAVLTGAAVAVTAQSMVQPRSETFEGTLVNVYHGTLTVVFTDGNSRTVKLQPDSLVLARRPATLDAIKPNDALGVAARRGSDGSLTANGINIFSPELWLVVRKGQFPMQSGDVMTNALVTRYAAGVRGRVLYLKYGEGTYAVHVPEGTRINRLLTEKVGDLRPGMRIIIRGTVNPEGDLVASSITVAEDRM